MPFIKGRAKTGGRKKGLETLFQICERHGVNPFEKMVEIAKATSDEFSFNRWEKIAAYIYAKPKEVEINEEQVRDYLESVTTEAKT